MKAIYFDGPNGEDLRIAEIPANMQADAEKFREELLDAASMFDDSLMEEIMEKGYEGDTLITSGLGGIFPKGIPVGTVHKVRKADLDVMSLMDVKPFQEFSTLEEVFVMQKEPDWIIQELLNE